MLASTHHEEMTEMQDDQLSPVGEGHTWLPTAPTTTHGTRDLIDTELVEVWDQRCLTG